MRHIRCGGKTRPKRSGSLTRLFLTSAAHLELDVLGLVLVLRHDGVGGGGGAAVRGGGEVVAGGDGDGVHLGVGAGKTE